MNKIWEKKSITDCYDKIIYIEGFGFGYMPKISSNNIVVSAQGQKYKLENLYYRGENGKFCPLIFNENQLFNILFNEEIFKCDSFIQNKFSSISIESVSIAISIPRLTYLEEIEIDPREWEKKRFKLDVSSEKDLASYVIYSSTLETQDCIKQCKNVIKEDTEYYSISMGKCKVTRAINSLKNGEVFCTIKTSDNISHDISVGQSDLIILPEHFDELSNEHQFLIFERDFNAYMLNTVVEVNKTSGDYLFIWHTLGGKHNYYIAINRVVKIDGKDSIYHLCNIERKDHYYSVSKEELNKFGLPLYIRLVVKNEKGKVVAFTKGLLIE